MTLTITIQIAPKQLKAFSVNILGDFDLVTDAIANCKSVNDLNLLEFDGLIKIN